jgi:hypothetical protein
MAKPTVCETWWTEILVSFERFHDAIIAAYTEANKEIELFHTVLATKGQLLRISPRINGDG